MKPTFIHFNLGHNDEDEMSCFFCDGPKCEQTFTHRAAGGMKMVGVHNSCAEKHMDRLTQTKQSE
jgi:hypothetical protein